MMYVILMGSTYNTLRHTGKENSNKNHQLIWKNQHELFRLKRLNAYSFVFLLIFFLMTSKVKVCSLPLCNDFEMLQYTE